MSKHARTSRNQDVSASRRANAEAISMTGVKGSSAGLYERKWVQFKKFCLNPHLQEGSGVLDPDGGEQPNSDIVGKIVEYFYYKVVETNCDPGEVVNIRSALASIYKRKFDRIGVWKVLDNGKTEGSPVNSLMVCESMKAYQRRKKHVGYKRALPFRYKYMVQLCKYMDKLGPKSIQACYVMAATSICFCLWLRIDELVKLTVSVLSVNETNEDGLPYILVSFNDRKYTRDGLGQSYALYELEDEKSACAYRHLKNWVSMYKDLLGRPLLPSDPLFPRCDEQVRQIYFGDSMVQATFMKTVNSAVSACGILPLNAAGEELGKFTAHCFRRGGAQHRFVTGKSRWPLDVVKWWGGWGTSDDMNTIIRYLLEETSKYENSFTHYLYTRGTDSRLFNTNITTFDDVGREINALQTTVVQRLSQFEQSSSANRLLVAQDLSINAHKLEESLNNSLDKFKEKLLSEIQETVGDVISTGNHASEHTVGQAGPCTQERTVHEGGPNTQETTPRNASTICTYIPKCRDWREVVAHWINGCPEKNLITPLKEWPVEARNATRKVASQFSDRKIVAEAYEDVGEEAFLERYSPDSLTLFELKKVIRNKKD